MTPNIEDEEMIKASGSFSEIVKSIEQTLEKDSVHKINHVVLTEILSCLNKTKKNCYLSTENPENFTKLNNNSLVRNFKIPKFNFFIEFHTFYHDYIGNNQYRQEFPTAFLKISEKDEHYQKIKSILNHDDDKDLIIPFYKIEDYWNIPVFGFSYDYKKSSLIPLFPVNKQKMDVEKEDDFIKKETSYFIHYLLEIYKRIVFVNFNKNVDHLYIEKNNQLYKIPHIYLKKEKELTQEEWLTSHKFDREKFFHLKNIINYGISFKE
jgi:hypothetical protein